MKAKDTRRRTWITILVIAGIVIVFLLLVDVGAVIDELRNADWALLGLATAMLLIGYYIQTLRWRHLLRNTPSITYTFHTMNIGTFTNLVTFIPTLPIRSFFMGDRQDVSIPQATSSLTIGFVFDLVMKILAILSAVVLVAPLNSNLATILLFIGVIFLIFGSILLLVRNIEKINSWITSMLLRGRFMKEGQVKGLLAGLAKGLEEVGSTRKIAIIFFFSLITLSFFIVFYIFGLMAFKINPPPEEMLVTVLMAVFFVNPTGPYLPGVFNVLLVVPMVLVSNISVEALVAYSIVIYAFLLVIWLVLGIWAMRHYKLSFSELRESAREGIEFVRQSQDSELIDGLDNA
jgi:uncharacterized protein (TIRG00374 family)